MKFLINRTSSYGNKEIKPCEEAIKGKYITKKELTGSETDQETVGWFITVNSLEELLALNKKHGALIINIYNYNHSIMEIEIYDDCRE